MRIPRNLAIAAMMIASAASAEPINSEKHDLAKSPVTCTFLRKAVEGPNSVWQCSDGSQRFSTRNFWSETPEDDVEAEAKPKPLDTTLPGDDILLTISVTADEKTCYQHRHGGRYCRILKVPAFSYLAVKDAETCLAIAPKLATRQFLRYRELYIPVAVEYTCEGAGATYPSRKLIDLGSALP